MKQIFYDFQVDDESLWYEFESVSNFKTVKKIIIFSVTDYSTDVYNVALVDALKDGSYSDTVVTNNRDLYKVIATVAQTILRFFEKYPSKLIYIEGSTTERTRLYRIIIAREFDDIESIFNIYGIIGKDIEPFQKNRNYISFLMSLKSQKNLFNLLYENN